MGKAARSFPEKLLPAAKRRSPLVKRLTYNASKIVVDPERHGESPAHVAHLLHLGNVATLQRLHQLRALSRVDR